MVNVPLEQLPLLFKAVLHSCKTSVSKEWAQLAPACALRWASGRELAHPRRGANAIQAGDRAVGLPARVARIFFCLFLFFYSFSYIFISRQSWMYDLQHDAHGSVRMQQMHSPAVYRMWRCLMLQCLLGLVLLYLGLGTEMTKTTSRRRCCSRTALSMICIQKHLS